VRLSTDVGPATARIAALALLAVLSLFVWGFVGRLTTVLLTAAPLAALLARVLLWREARAARA
jgi:hypothetical protein